MRKFKYLLVGMGLLSMSACHEMLNLDPISDTEKDKIGYTTDEVNALVVGCYAGMRAPLSTEWKLTEIRSDNSLQASTSSTSIPNLLLDKLDMFQLDATHPDVYQYWCDVYQNVATTNYTLSRTLYVEEPALRKQFEGEALFIRSYHFFNLVRLFGPVFVPTRELTPEEAKKQTRVPAHVIYNQIIADLTTASTQLPDRYPPNGLGRITSWTAKAMLAKVYLTLDSLEQAKTLLSDVVNNSGYKLLPNYADVFSVTNEMNPEILFAIRFQAGGVGMGSSFANWFAPTGSGDYIVNGNGSGFNYPTASLYALYEPTDTRRDVCIERFASAASTKLYVNKYLSYVKVRYDADNDWPVLRFSDVLLMYAEVLGKLGGPDQGMPYLNRVRERAGVAAYGSTASIDDFMDMIYNERRIELAFENDRWFDMLRSGKTIDMLYKHYLQELTHYNSSGYSDAQRKPLQNMEAWRLMLPIPQREIDTNNEVKIVQNVGY